MDDNREFRTPSTDMVVDIVTGEEKGLVVAYELEGKNKRKKTKSDINHKYSDNGNFWWTFYAISKRFFGELDDSTFVKMIYLLTYMDYGDRVARFGGKNKEAITLKDLPKVLGIKRKEDTDRFIKILEDNKIVRIYNDNIYFSCKIFSKGKLRPKKKKRAVRIYVDAVRKLYKGMPTRSHKKLAYIYRLIPYVNIRYNILCENVEEKNIKKIKMISMKSICDILGYSYENVSRLKKDMNSIKVNGEYIFMYINFGQSEDAFLTVNPKVFCASDDDKAIEFIKGMFENENVLDKQ